MSRPRPVERRVVVIGAGFTGLLAAAAVAPYADTVQVLDRDDLVAGRGTGRVGVPQARHAHLLHAGGREATERLVPGFTAEVIAAGGLAGDPGTDAVLCSGTERLPAAPSGRVLLAAGHSLVEHVLRRRVEALPGVRLNAGISALGLVLDLERTCLAGVRVATRDGEEPTVVEAGLVVDASGQASRTPVWLDHLGLEAPPVRQRPSDGRRTTRAFAGPEDLDAVAVLQAASRPRGRSGVAVHETSRLWRVTLADGSGAPVPCDLTGFRAFARMLERSELADLVDRLEPLDDGAEWRPGCPLRRVYERTRLPSGLVVLGDAVATLQPGSTLGMTVAAHQAVALRAALDERGGLDPTALDGFSRRCARILDPAWTGATGLRHALRR